MSNNNNSGSFFKFKNVQLVRKPNSGRQTRQNTDIRMQGTAEEQFVGIAAAARAEVLNDIDDILTDDNSVDYSPPKHQPLEPQVQIQNNIQQGSDSDETNNSTPESATDSSLDTLSIEVIQPHKGLEIRLPKNQSQRAPPNSPESQRTNVAVPISDDLLTEDEETGDQDVPLTETPTIPDLKGRQETLSPTPQVPQTVQSAIEYQSGFNNEGFPNLEDYLYKMVGQLPCQSLLRLALDSVFEEFPEISAIQTKVYHMLKCHLSIINHSSITQFDDISLSNHDFDRVAGPDFHNVSSTESRPDLSMQTDFNDTYYSMFSRAQHQVYRVTERSLGRLRKDRANSCPDIVQQLNKDFDYLSNSNWRYTTAHECLYLNPYYPKNDQQTQTEITHTLQVKEIGAQYSSPSDSSDSSSSDLDSDIEGTENITVAQRYLHRHFVSSEDLYTNPTRQIRDSGLQLLILQKGDQKRNQ